jgi:hypothetical protein
MIADLTGALATVNTPAGRKWRERLSGGRFEINECLRSEPASRERRANSVEHARRVRRVEKYDLERLRLASEKRERVLRDYFCIASAAQPFERLREVPRDLRLAIDERHVRRAAR